MQLKTILFFDRENLSILFAGLTHILKDKYRILHVAYSDQERKYLDSQHIVCDYVFKDFLYENYQGLEVDIDAIRLLDDDIRTFTDHRFTLNAAIQSDRTFAGIEYEHALKMALLYDRFWESVCKKEQVAYIFHETTSLLMNQLACIVGKKYGAIYTYFLHATSHNYKYAFRIGNYDDGSNLEFASIFKELSDQEIAKSQKQIDDYISTFKESYSNIACANFFPKRNSLRILLGALKSMLFAKTYSIRDKQIDLLEKFLNSSIRFNGIDKCINQLKYKKIKFNKPSPADKYYYYSIHLEPEAVVLYWGDGLYAGQVKLIENIAAQLPAGTYLYVKDHPHIIGYRDVADYEKLQSIPNIKLIPSEVPGKFLISNAIGVFSINGTAALEAALLRKVSYVFGNIYYTAYRGIIKIEHIKNVSAVLSQKRKPIDDEEYNRFVLAYLNSTHSGYADFTGGMKRLKANPISTSSENILAVANALKNYMEKYCPDEKELLT